MEPDLEVVQIRRGESFKAWSHGYPFHTVRWHFHPEYELHQVVATSGRYFVGDFIGDFEPGNLVLTGPNLPHNWVSDLPAECAIPLRGRILQFSEEFIGDLMKVMPELSGLAALLDFSRRGALFTRSTSDALVPLMEEIVTANGVRRIELFLMILGITLSRRPTGASAVQPKLSARSVRLHVGGNEQGTRIHPEESDATFRRSEARCDRRSIAKCIFALVPPAHGHVIGAICQAAAYQSRVSDIDERRAGFHHRHLLRGRLQQSLQF
ncbi:hypothetical protein ACVWXL_002207 [Bradyrhizobium sp. GM22.5]